ncbi:MAG TPA: VTC domain-containing protein [Polyangiaceae bacterium]|nr:VTC domain-containing protein [Polyangiaceae bacterium]
MSGSSLAPLRASAPEADAAITAEREETKYLVEPARLPTLLRQVAEHLEPHRFSGEAANRLPGAEHFVTTLYFDTPTRAYYTAARQNQQSNLKIRAKEYYDLHPSLAELATDPEQILRYQPWLWFELKRREGLSTSKRRFRFPKLSAATLFDEQRSPELSQLTGSERDDADAMIAHVRAQAEPIAPSALVNYRRLSFQNADSTLRVTVDLGLSYFPVPVDLFRRARPLSKSELGPRAGAETRAVVELKRLAPLPGWLEQALAQANSSAVTFSKFVAASEAVHGA